MLSGWWIVVAIPNIIIGNVKILAIPKIILIFICTSYLKFITNILSILLFYKIYYQYITN